MQQELFTDEFYLAVEAIIDDAVRRHQEVYFG